MWDLQLSLDDQEKIRQDLRLQRDQEPQPISVEEFAESTGLKKMLVLRTLTQLKPENTELRAFLQNEENRIRFQGHSQITESVVERITKMRPLNTKVHDPLGIYKPGDMFYVDENDRLAAYYPVLTLVPSFLLILIVTLMVILGR